MRRGGHSTSATYIKLVCSFSISVLLSGCSQCKWIPNFFLLIISSNRRYQFRRILYSMFNDWKNRPKQVSLKIQ